MNAIQDDPEVLDGFLRDSLSILNESLQLIDRGEIAFHRVLALQLRLLLCDTTREHGRINNVSLIPRLDPKIELPILGPSGFSKSKKLALKQWLDQNIDKSEKSMTIRELIRRVCDLEGGAHVDMKLRFKISPTQINLLEKISRMLVRELVNDY